LKKKLVYIALIFSLIVNSLLIYDHIENAKKLNISWSNSIGKFASPIVLSTIQPSLLDKLDVDTLSTAKRSLEILVAQLAGLQMLPEGGNILTPSTMGKFFAVTNYEHSLMTKIEKDINSSKKVSSNDLEQLSKINKAWEKLLATLGRKRNEINPFSPIFQGEQWKAVLDDASKELDGLNLAPLPANSPW